MARYGTFNYDSGVLYSQGTAEFPILEPGITRVPWWFIDTNTGDEYEFAVNPLNASVPSPQKTVTTEYTTAGTPINFQGRDAPATMSISGTILYEEHFNAMIEWSEKTKQVNITDDLLRKYWVYITSFNPTRQYTPDYPWRHEYTMEATVINWA